MAYLSPLIGGLEHEFYFPQELGWWSNLANSYFSGGRLKPPTSFRLVKDDNLPLNSTQEPWVLSWGVGGRSTTNQSRFHGPRNEFGLWKRDEFPCSNAVPLDLEVLSLEGQPLEHRMDARNQKKTRVDLASDDVNSLRTGKWWFSSWI